MKKKLRVLIVEDILSDAELAERELRTVLKNYMVKVVDTEEGFVKALKTFKPDLIISDYQMPTFDGLSALKIKQKMSPLIPFIILTGSMNEDTAVECMKEGADDYVIKEHIQRLGLAILNALEKKKNELKRKQAVEALQASEEKFRNFVETSPDLVFRLTKTGYIDYISSRVEDLYGYKPDELIGKHLKSTTPIGEIPKVIKALNMILAGKTFNYLEVNQKSKTGQIIPMEINAVPVYQGGEIVGLQGIMRDVSERRQAEEEIRKLSTAVRQSPSVIAITDIKGNLEYVNPKFTELTGYTSEEALGKNPRILKSGELPDEIYKKLWDTISSGKEWHGEFHNKKKSGELYWEATSISPIFDKQGKITNYIKVAEDITERKQAEERLKKTMDATIETMSKIIEAKDPYTSGHQHRVCQLAVPLAQELNLSQDKIEGIRIASLIHDIGKIGLPTEILSKPTKLTDIEFSLIKGHSQIGYDILKSIDFSYPIAQIVLQHHEKINGSGYPNNLKGDEILLEAKIIGVADVVEAMSSHRPYRPALGIDAALEEISQNKGILYDPEVVDTCIKLFKEKRFKF